MTGKELVSRQLRLLAFLIASFAIAIVGHAAAATDKATVQKALDQRAAQMQADGTVQYCNVNIDYGFSEHDRKIAYDSSTPREIVNTDELRRLSVTGRYKTQLVLLIGSRPMDPPKCFLDKRLTFYRLAIRPNVNIGIRSAYFYGKRCYDLGSTTTTLMPNGSSIKSTPCIVADDDKRSKYVKSRYVGAVAAYLILMPVAPDYMTKNCPKELEGLLSTIRALSVNKGKTMSYNDPCLQLHPEWWDDYIRTYVEQATNLMSESYTDNFEVPLVPNY